MQQFDRQVNTRGLRCAIYARKSSEDSERQAASISSQLEHLRRHAKLRGFDVVREFTEEKSAKAPGRPVFTELLRYVKRRGVDAILCWSADRLARNPVDAGHVQWLLQQGTLARIETPNRTYFPNDNALLMSVEFGMANQYVRDLSENVKRGLRSRARAGWYPGPAPYGYVNDRSGGKGRGRIMTHPTEFRRVRRILRRFSEGDLSVDGLLRLIRHEWRYLGRTGKPFSKTNLHRILRRPLYYGQFEHAGRLYPGKHTPAISKAQFLKNQAVLAGRTRATRAVSLEFQYRGLLTCGGCGGHVTAERKTKRTSRQVHHYVYYHCTRRKQPRCTQPSAREHVVERALLAFLRSVRISQERAASTIQELDRWIEEHEQEIAATAQTHGQQAEAARTKLHRLVEMSLDGLVDDATFKRRRTDLEATIEHHLLRTIQSPTAAARHHADETANMLMSAVDSVERFRRTDQDLRRTFVSAFATRAVLTDGNVVVEPTPLGAALIETESPGQPKLARFEPQRTLCSSGVASTRDVESPLLRACRNLVLTALKEDATHLDP